MSNKAVAASIKASQIAKRHQFVNTAINNEIDRVKKDFDERCKRVNVNDLSEWQMYSFDSEVDAVFDFMNDMRQAPKTYLYFLRIRKRQVKTLRKYHKSQTRDDHKNALRNLIEKETVDELPF